MKLGAFRPGRIARAALLLCLSLAPPGLSGSMTQTQTQSQTQPQSGVIRRQDAFYSHHVSASR